MPESGFNVAEGVKVARSKLIALINVGSGEMPEWAPMGYRVEDSSEGLDWQRDTKKDIIGETYSSMKTPIITQPFDPWPLAGGDKAQHYLWDLAVKEQDAQKLANLDMLIVHDYEGTSGSAAFAERYEACAVEVNSLGGAGGGDLSMGCNVTYGGKRTVGTAKTSGGSVTFSPAEVA